MDLVTLNGKIVQTWINLIGSECAALSGAHAQLCTLVADMGFTNWLNVILSTEPNAYCEQITLCSPSMPEFMQPRVVQHCAPCVEFMNDFFTIARVSQIFGSKDHVFNSNKCLDFFHGTIYHADFVHHFLNRN